MVMTRTRQALASLSAGGSLAERTYEALKVAILANQLPAGTALSVPELARQLNVSRSPVREAVQRLIYDGLATHAPYRGAEVARVDLDDLRELYIVRELLEGLAARLATERLDGDALARLRGIIDDHERAVSAEADNATHIELDIRFHDEIRDLAANRHLSAVLAPISGRSHFALHSLWRSPEAARLALDEHEAIVDAMITGDPDLAEQAAQRHIARLRVRLAHVSMSQSGTGNGRTKARISTSLVR